MSLSARAGAPEPGTLFYSSIFGIAAVLTTLLFGCEAASPLPTISGGDADSDADGDADGDSDGDADGDSDGDTDTETTPDAGLDCAELLPGPVPAWWMDDMPIGNDLAFDVNGNLISMFEGDLQKIPKSSPSSVWVEDAGCVNGLAALPTGDFVCGGQDELYLFDKLTGARRTVLSGLRQPGGIEIDAEGDVYVTEHDGDSVRAIRPYTSAGRLIAEDLPAPIGLSFSPDFRTLYVTSDCNAIYSIAFNEAREPAAPKPFLSLSDPVAVAAGMSGCLTGLGVDACGNVYVLTGDEPRLFRIAPDASAAAQLVDLRGLVAVAWNLEWGQGMAGFFDDALYVACSDEMLFEVLVDVPSKSYSPN